MDSNVEQFILAGTPKELAESVVQYLRDWKNRPDLSVSPTDNIYRKYGIVDEDLDDFVLEVADSNGRRPPESTAYWQTPVETLQDLADFVMTFPKRSQSSSELDPKPGMTKFAIRLKGENYRVPTIRKKWLFLKESASVVAGMTTTRFIEADSANEAIDQAISIVKAELLSRGLTTETSTIGVEEIREDEAAFNLYAPGGGFTFHTEE